MQIGLLFLKPLVPIKLILVQLNNYGKSSRCLNPRQNRYIIINVPLADIFKAKKKKWSKGKVKDKANNAVLLDKPTYDKLFKEVGSYRFVSVSVLVERLKINGSLARKALRELEAKGIIKPIEKHSAQQIYSIPLFVLEGDERLTFSACYCRGGLEW